MKLRYVRWALTAVMLVCLACLISSPAAAEVEPLPMDQMAPGMPTDPNGWTYVDKEEACEGSMVLKYSSKTREWTPTNTNMKVNDRDWERYEDDSISMEVTYFTVCPAYKPKNVACAAVRVKIADPSQLRTAMSHDDYSKREYVKASDMAKQKNAVVAVNGDYFKYHYDVGYVVRQGEFYRDKLNGERDLLIIDNKGDFHPVFAATSETAKAYIADMESQGLSVVNTITLGPVLVQNGQALDIKESITAKHGEFQWRYPQQRVAICQLGELEYVIVETYGKTDSSQGLSLPEFADLIAHLYPDCLVAYNLDGGGSTNVVVNGERIHKTPGARKISDIIYFASADSDN